jgi:hypothetical protein
MIVLDGDVYDMSPDQVMAYAQVYVRNTTGADLECKLGISSDDSVQVLVNGLEVWINSAGRAGSDACEPQDMTPDGFLFLDNVVLEMGENSIIVKVFEGAGDFNFALVVLDPESGDPITTGLEVSKYPEGVCPIAPVQVTRSINTQETQPVQHETLPRWSSGNTYTVSLALSDVRGANERPGCPQAAGMVTIVESAPPGWTPSAPSDGGSVNGQEVSWTLNLSGQGGGAGILNLSYGVEAPEGNGLVSLAGTISEPGNIATFAVGGTNLLLNPGTFNGEGFITRWLLLGPYSQRSGFGWGATPSEANMRMDFLTDGARSERDIAPREGDTINTVYAPAGTSPGLGISPAPCPINPGGVPTWFGWLDFDDAINFGDYYCGGIDLCMMYAVTYVYADREMSVDIGLDSDDAVQVILDGNEIWLNSVARGVGGPNTVADTIFASQTPDLMAFSAGCHKLMVKVFEGAGDHQFRLRFQDPATQLPIGDDEGLHILRDPTCSTTFVETNCTNGRDDDGDSRIDCADADCVPDAACGVSRFVRGDVDGSSVINITDGINLLNFLFLGGSRPPCMDAADVDDSGGDLPNITDAIFLLNWLFQGGTRPPPPVPSTPDYATGDCGADPPDRPDSMDCLLSPAKCRA